MMFYFLNKKYWQAAFNLKNIKFLGNFSYRNQYKHKINQKHNVLVISKSSFNPIFNLQTQGYQTSHGEIKYSELTKVLRENILKQSASDLILKKEQIQEYKENGFLVINNVLSEEEVNEIMDIINTNQSVQDHFRKNQDGYNFHMIELALKHSAFLKYATHPKIIKIISSLLGEENEIQLQHSKLTIKPRGNKNKVPWHQDFQYTPHTNRSLLGIMICLVDFKPENGCMKMIKGSHKHGLFTHQPQEDLTSDRGCSDALELKPFLADSSKIMHITPKKGGISIHHCLTVHASDDNVSEHPRYSLVFEYRTADAHQLGGRIWQDTGLICTKKNKNQEKIRCEELSVPLISSKISGNYEKIDLGDALRQYGLFAKKINYFVSEEPNIEFKGINLNQMLDVRQRSR